LPRSRSGWACLCHGQPGKCLSVSVPLVGWGRDESVIPQLWTPKGLGHLGFSPGCPQVLCPDPLPTGLHRFLPHLSWAFGVCPTPRLLIPNKAMGHSRVTRVAGDLCRVPRACLPSCCHHDRLGGFGQFASSSELPLSVRNPT
jgi:hypothetical protein